MSIPNVNAGELIRRARTGSNSSLGKLLDAYRDYLLRVANDRIQPGLRPKLAASDVVQGSMLVASRDFGQFRGETEREFRAWLLRIVTTQIVDGMRRFTEAEMRRVNREAPRGDSALRGVPDQRDTPSQLASRNEQALRLLEAIAALPAELRDVVEARYLGGETFQQVAERLDIPVTTCRRRWLEAVEILGAAMRPDA